MKHEELASLGKLVASHTLDALKAEDLNDEKTRDLLIKFSELTIEVAKGMRRLYMSNPEAHDALASHTEAFDDEFLKELETKTIAEEFRLIKHLVVQTTTHEVLSHELSNQFHEIELLLFAEYAQQAEQLHEVGVSIGDIWIYIENYFDTLLTALKQ